MELPVPPPAEDDGRATDEVPRSKLVSLSARFQGYHLGSPDSLPPIDEDAPPIPAALFRSSAPPLGAGSPAARPLGAGSAAPARPLPSKVAPVSDLEDAHSGELSSGLFESLDWDEAPPPKVDRPERAIEPKVKREPVYVRHAIVEEEQETLPPTSTRPQPQTDAFAREALASDWWVDADAHPEELDRQPLSEAGGPDPEFDGEQDTAVGAAPLPPAHRRSGLVSPLDRSGLVSPEALALDEDELSLDPEPIDQAIHRAIDRAAAAEAREAAEEAAREGAAARQAAIAAAAAVDDRATPASPEPRPEPDAVVDWPPPMDRPAIDYPADWSPRTDDWGTLIVIQPRGVSGRAVGVGGVWMVDMAAWSLGFLAMFFTGLVTTGSALLVLFALSLP